MFLCFCFCFFLHVVQCSMFNVVGKEEEIIKMKKDEKEGGEKVCQ